MERKEAIEIVRNLYNESLFMKKDKEAMVTLIPELKENEDEKIRKFITHELACLRASEETGSDRYEELTNAITWLEKQGEQKEIDYNEELEKCKTNPLYFFDKYAKVKFKEQNSTGKVMIMELFGNIYEEVEDNGSEYACSSCALFKICEITKPNLPCVRVDGSLNRHFILASTKLNAEKKNR